MWSPDRTLETNLLTLGQLWGNCIGTLPLPKMMNDFIYSPVVVSRGWPVAPSLPWMQAELSNAAYESGYTRYLVSPALPVWVPVTALPVKAYDRFLHESWWRSDFRKYGFAGLRLSSFLQGVDGSEESRSLKSTMYTEYQALATCFFAFGEEHCKWMFESAVHMVEKAGQYITARYLFTLALQTAADGQLRARLFFDQKTWDDK